MMLRSIEGIEISYEDVLGRYRPDKEGSSAPLPKWVQVLCCEHGITDDIATHRVTYQQIRETLIKITDFRYWGEQADSGQEVSYKLRLIDFGNLFQLLFYLDHLFGDYPQLDKLLLGLPLLGLMIEIVEDKIDIRKEGGLERYLIDSGVYRSFSSTDMQRLSAVVSASRQGLYCDAKHAKHLFVDDSPEPIPFYLTDAFVAYLDTFNDKHCNSSSSALYQQLQTHTGLITEIMKLSISELVNARVNDDCTYTVSTCDGSSETVLKFR